MKVLKYCIIALALSSFIGCAKVGAPTGGIKDTAPPDYIGGEPENRSVNFNDKEIICEFNEYIQLKDLNKELLVSPPLKEKPIIRIRDKSLRIDLNNELHPQTTYTINFGNALSDLNEGNPLPDFEFVFSTGDHIDSLAVAGKVLNAFDHKPSPDEEVLVMLYENLADSAPLVEIPRYIGRASKHGLFSINNVHAGTYRIMALQDAGGNLLYDPRTDAIAFTDSLLRIDPETVKPMNFIKDTVKVQPVAEKTGGRTTKAAVLKSQVDTARQHQGKKINAMTVSLFYFQEEDNKVFLDTKKRESPEKLFFTFSRPPFDSVGLAPLNFNTGKDWFLKEHSENGDTLTYWITDSLIAKMDTLKFKVSFSTTDSSNNLVIKSDTVVLRYQAVVERSTGSRRAATRDKEKPSHVLALKAGVSSRSAVNLNKPLQFSAERPLGAILPDKIELFRVVDSTSIAKPFTCVRDSNNIRIFHLASAWDEDSHYRLLLMPGAVSDIYGRVNDTMDIKFTTQKAEYYGRILATLSGSSFPVILQVMDQKDRVVVTHRVSEPGKVVFDFLPPAGYVLKAVYDKNQNGKWDTGNYLEHIQPEKVFFYKLPVDLRSNWDVEAIWDIGE